MGVADLYDFLVCRCAGATLTHSLKAVGALTRLLSQFRHPHLCHPHLTPPESQRALPSTRRHAVRGARWGLEYLDLLRDAWASELTSP